MRFLEMAKKYPRRKMPLTILAFVDANPGSLFRVIDLVRWAESMGIDLRYAASRETIMRWLRRLVIQNDVNGYIAVRRTPMTKLSQVDMFSVTHAANFKFVRAVVATTGPDSFGNVFPVEELERMAKAMSEAVVRNGIEGPVIGKVVDASVVDGKVEAVLSVDSSFDVNVGDAVGYEMETETTECGTCGKKAASEVDLCEHLRGNAAGVKSDSICRGLMVESVTLQEGEVADPSAKVTDVR